MSSNANPKRTTPPKQIEQIYGIPTLTARQRIREGRLKAYRVARADRSSSASRILRRCSFASAAKTKPRPTGRTPPERKPTQCLHESDWCAMKTQEKVGIPPPEDGEGRGTRTPAHTQLPDHQIRSYSQPSRSVCWWEVHQFPPGARSLRRITHLADRLLAAQRRTGQGETHLGDRRRASRCV